MIIRHAADDDHTAMGAGAAIDQGRNVVVAVDGDGVIVGVAAHTSLVADTGRVWPEHRYLMVTAVRRDHQRCGIAQLLVESLVADVARRGARTIEWLVHPANEASLSFSRQLFPEADETSPPDDAPYVRFVTRL